MATILEAIDIQVEVSALKYSQLSSASSGEPSSEIRKRVIAARQIQENRYREYTGIHCNAQMTDRLLHQYCVLDEETNNTLQLAMERLHICDTFSIYYQQVSTLFSAHFFMLTHSF